MARARSRVEARRQSVSTESRRRGRGGAGGESPDTTPNSVGNAKAFNEIEQNIVGVDESQIPRSAEVRSEVFRGAYIKSVNVPDTAAVGERFNVTGTLGYDNIGRVVSAVTCRVRIESPALDNPITQVVGDLKHGQSRRFNVTVPARGSEGSIMSVNVIPQNRGTGGWRTGNDEVRRVEVVSEGEAQREEVLSLLPSVAVGGAGGYAAGRFTGRSPLSLAGVGAALAAGASTGGLPFTDISLPSLPTTQIAVIGGAAAGIGLLLRSSGASGVLQPAGEAAGSAIGTAAEAGRRALPSGN